MSLVSVFCCQVEVTKSSWSLAQRNPIECGVSECDREALIMRRLWPTRGLLRHGEIVTYPVFLFRVNIWKQSRLNSEKVHCDSVPNHMSFFLLSKTINNQTERL
jgi:hypothetical protein